MGLFGFKKKTEDFEQVVPFEFFQDKDGEINSFFSLKFEGFAQGKRYRFNVGFWQDLNAGDDRADCKPFLDALEKMEEKVVPVTLTMKDGELEFGGLRVDTKYLAEKTGYEAFNKLDYDFNYE
ncbi:MAG: hypothetical protein J6X94_08345 [Lachnospiraceae bacterium]|nr:hypothetical protein [Lachnospiraceae bacterium]